MRPMAGQMKRAGHRLVLGVLLVSGLTWLAQAASDNSSLDMIHERSVLVSRRTEHREAPPEASPLPEPACDGATSVDDTPTPAGPRALPLDAVSPDARPLRPSSAVSPSLPFGAPPTPVGRDSATMRVEATDPTLAAVPTPAAKPDGEPEKNRPPVEPPKSGVTVSDFDLESPQIEAALLNGVQPGITTEKELLATWGEPRQRRRDTDGQTFVYRFTPFKSVEVHVTNERVDEIQLELGKLSTPNLLARQLRLDNIREVEITDDEGHPLGLALPERGVLFTFVPEQPLVSHVLLQPITAEPFLLRAERDLERQLGQAVDDLRVVLRLDPEHAHARWRLAGAYLRMGKVTKAESVAASAVELQPGKPAYRLLWARTLEAVGRFPEAVRETRKTIEVHSASGVVKAQALAQLGRLASLGAPDIARKSTKLHEQAIELADALATHNDPQKRLTAKKTLVASHLAIAREVSRGNWQQKATVVPQWLERASALSEGAIEHDGASLWLRMDVAVEALAALASFQPVPDPEGWVREAQQTADTLLSQARDEETRQPIYWRLGQAYFHALRIEHTRAKPAGALRYGQQAIKHLSRGAVGRDGLATYQHFVGRLYFHIGAVHAIHQEDHVKAVAWFDKAVPLLRDPVPTSPFSHPRQHGDMLVSMGVSFWDVGQQDRAVKLTSLGAEILQRASEEGFVEPVALAVAYGNLATMHKKLGDEKQALGYLELADRAVTVRK